MKKRKRSKKNQRRGFTLIEILVVSTIVVVISAIGLVSFSSAAVGARDAQRSKDLENMRTTLFLFRSENGYYPDSETAGLVGPSRITFSLPRRVMARLASSLIVGEAQARIVDPTGFTPPPIDDSTSTPLPTFIIETAEPTIIVGTSKPTPTPTPTPTLVLGTPIPTATPTISVGTPTPTATASATPTPTPDPDVVPKDKLGYQAMVAELSNEGYLVTEDVAYDPINDNTYYYGYDSTGTGFELTARLEKDSSVITLTD